jgi:tetratricopeptide (TPR) repeat protein
LKTTIPHSHPKIVKIIVLFACMLMVFSSHAQSGTIEVEGQLQDYVSMKNLDGGEVNLFKNGNPERNIPVNSNGKFSFEVMLGAIYRFKFTHLGHFPKIIEVDTRNIPGEQASAGFTMEIDITLLDKNDCFQAAIFDAPYGKAAFDEYSREIAFDFDYTDRQRKQVDEEIERCESLKERMAGIQKEFDKLMQEGGQAMGTEKYPEAIAKFESAIKILPKNEVAPQRLQEAKNKYEEWKKANAGNEAFAAAMKAGDELKKAGDYKGAREKYQLAQTHKPNDPSPAVKMKELEDLAAAGAKRKEYEQWITSADQQFAANSFQECIANYEKALALYPSEKYPQTRIAEARKAMKAKAAEADALAAKQAKEAKEQQELEARLKEDESRKAREAEEKRLAEAAQKEKDALAQKERDARLKEEEDRKAREAEEKRLAEASQKERDALAQKERDDRLKEEQARKAREAEEKRMAEASQKEKDALAQRERAERLKEEEARKAREAEEKRLAEAAQQKKDELAQRERDTRLTEEEARKAREAENARLAKATADTVGAHQRALDKRYQQLIQTADKALIQNNLALAKSEYESALGLKPQEKYPRTKLDMIAKKMTESSSTAEVIPPRLPASSKESDDDSEYQRREQRANALFAERNWREAKAAYMYALEVKPSAYLPKKRMQEISFEIAKQEREERTAAAARKTQEVREQKSAIQEEHRNAMSTAMQKAEDARRKRAEEMDATRKTAMSASGYRPKDALMRTPQPVNEADVEKEKAVEAEARSRREADEQKRTERINTEKRKQMEFQQRMADRANEQHSENRKKIAENHEKSAITRQ